MFECGLVNREGAGWVKRKPYFFALIFFLLGWILLGHQKGFRPSTHRLALPEDNSHILDVGHRRSFEQLGPPSGVHLGKKNTRLVTNLALKAGIAISMKQQGNDIDDEVSRPSQRNGAFQKLATGTYVYSAFYDNRYQQRPIVRIIAVASQLDLENPFYCHLHYDNLLKPPVILSSYINLDIDLSDRSFKYNSTMIICNVTSLKPPTYVSLTRGRYEIPSVSLPVHAVTKRIQEKNITVCFHQALKYNYRNYHQFIEATEVSRLFGAESFVVYNHSGHAAIRPFALHYMQDGLFDFYNWPLDDAVSNKTFNYGQSAIINDCLYRYMYRTKYLAFVDFDEVLVPRKHDTWMSMLSDNTCDNDWSFVMLRNVFFRLDYTKDSAYEHNSTLTKVRVNTLSRTLRDNYTWPCLKRSKLIVRPEKIEISGVHSARQKTGKFCCLSDRIGLLHHYRFWNKKFPTYLAWKKRLEKAGEKRLVNINVRDRYMHQFSDTIFRNVYRVQTTVNESDQLVIDAELMVPWWR